MYVNWKNIISYHFENNVHGKINLKGSELTGPAPVE
jgi:hypothetical protein